MKTLMQRLGYAFKNEEHLKIALTHRSVKAKNNERLEFLGDAILSMIIADALFKQCPHAKEGELSRLRASLVNGEALAEIAQEFALGDYLYLGPGELKSGGSRRKSILADAFEAVIGAIYLDSDILTCQTCVLSWFETRLQQALNVETQKDPKSQLQEYLQGRKLPLPHYEIVSITGEQHEQSFHMVCTVPSLSYRAEGVGATRRAAEQIAATHFFNWLVESEKHGK